MTGPAGFVIWGVERREASREGRPEASHETRDQGGNFRLSHTFRPVTAQEQLLTGQLE